MAEPMTGASGVVAGVTELLVTEAELVPMALVALTVKVYETPLVRPVTMTGEEALETTCRPSFEVTVYEAMADPPLLPSSEKVTVAWPLEAMMEVMVGASGTLAGVTELLGREPVLVPMALVAVTVKVYGVPLVRPVRVIGEEPPETTCRPSFDVTVYEVMADPPLLPSSEKVTVAWPLEAMMEVMVGASGAVAGTMELLVPDEVLVPIALVAVTVKVYVVPLVRPVRVIGDEAPETTCRPSLEVTVYEVMVDPPLFAGAEKVMVA